MSLNLTNSPKNKINKEKQNNSDMNLSDKNSENILLFKDDEKYNYMEENEKKIISFYSKFKFLCCKHKINNLRKNHIDIIIKKVKIKLFKGIHEVLKYCLNTNINRLPQNFINNIKIEFNRKYLDKTISEIYLEYEIIPSLKEIIENKMVKKDKTEIFILFMNSNLINIIKVYLTSNLFIYDKKKLEKKSGLNDVILFDFVANNICDYFQYGSTSTNKKGNSNKNPVINPNNINNSGNNDGKIDNDGEIN